MTIAFKPVGADVWAKLTEEYAQKQLAFTIDTTVVSAPLVQPGPQFGGITQITGRFTTASAQALARTINRATTPLSFQVATKEVLRPTK
nr:hypothetical protein [Nocardia nova]